MAQSNDIEAAKASSKTRKEGLKEPIGKAAARAKDALDGNLSSEPALRTQAERTKRVMSNFMGEPTTTHEKPKPSTGSPVKEPSIAELGAQRDALENKIDAAKAKHGLPLNEPVKPVALPSASNAPGWAERYGKAFKEIGQDAAMNGRIGAIMLGEDVAEAAATAASNAKSNISFLGRLSGKAAKATGRAAVTAGSAVVGGTVVVGKGIAEITRDKAMNTKLGLQMLAENTRDKMSAVNEVGMRSGGGYSWGGAVEPVAAKTSKLPRIGPAFVIVSGVGMGALLGTGSQVASVSTGATTNLSARLSAQSNSI